MMIGAIAREYVEGYDPIIASISLRWMIHPLSSSQASINIPATY